MNRYEIEEGISVFIENLFSETENRIKDKYPGSLNYQQKFYEEQKRKLIETIKSEIRHSIMLKGDMNERI